MSSTTKITEIRTDDAPNPLGPYSQAVLAGNTIYCSGNIAIDPKTNELVECNGDVKEETRQVLKNMDAVLKKAGATASNVVRCTVFLDDLSNFVSFCIYINTIYIKNRRFEFFSSFFSVETNKIAFFSNSGKSSSFLFK